MANMTIGSVVARGGKSRMRKVTFTHTDVGTAAGAATTSFPITGRLLKYVTVGGDAEWQFALNDGWVDVFSSGNLNGDSSAANTNILQMSTTIIHKGIAMAGHYLTCLTSNIVEGANGTAPTITIFWEESAECNAIL